MAGRGSPLGADLEALEVGGDDLVEGHAALRRQLGGVAHLGVGHPVHGQVLGALRGDPDDRVTLLHDPHRVGEGLEVELERLAVGAPADVGGEGIRIARRQAVVAVLGGEIHDRGRPQAAVEVVVEERLGCLLDRLGAQHRLPMVQGPRWHHGSR
jgi:hypothetical protein